MAEVRGKIWDFCGAISDKKKKNPNQNIIIKRIIAS